MPRRVAPRAFPPRRRYPPQLPRRSICHMLSGDIDAGTVGFVCRAVVLPDRVENRRRPALDLRADHFGVPAREMTGAEIVQACGERGHRLEPVRALARLIDDCDRRRYDPDPVQAAWVRTRTGELIARIRELRIEPRQTEVPAVERIAAEQAWSGLQEYARREAPAPLTGEGS